MLIAKNLIYTILFIPIFSLSALYIDSIEFQKINADYGIVYGNKVNEDGSLSERLKARLDASLELFESKRISGLIVSGGIGKEGYDEADVMRQYLLVNGIPKNAIIVDSDGYTSSKTSQNAATLIDKNSKVVAISQRYHISRTKLSLRNAGFVDVYGYCPNYYEFRDIYSTIREVPAWLIYWLKGL